MLIDTPSELAKCLTHVERFEIIAVDTETTGVEPFNGDRLCGICITAGKEDFYLPFRHEEGRNLDYCLMKHVIPVLTDPKKTYVYFNGKFDLEMLWMDGFPLPKTIEDAQVANHLMDSRNRYKSLKQLGNMFLYDGASDESDELIELIMSKFDVTKDNAKGMICRTRPEETEPYGCKDTRLTMDLRNFFVEERDWEGNDQPYSNLGIWGLLDIYRECNEYLLYFTETEILGIKMDRKRILSNVRKVEKKVQYWTEVLWELTGEKINPASPKQVQEWLDVSSVDEDHLIQILEDPTADDKEKAVANAQLEYKTWSKVNSTYYEPYLDLMDDDDVLHTNYHVNGTVNSRLSSSNPNLQNVPKEKKVKKINGKDVVLTAYEDVKRSFVARDGYTLVSIDYSQAEVVLGRNYSKDEALTEILKNNLNMHDVTANDCDIPRFAAKTLNFMVDYGGGAKKMAKKLRKPIDECKEWIRKYWKKFVVKKQAFQAASRTAEEHGYIRLWTGRIRRYGDDDKFYTAWNTLQQGGVAEVIRVAMIKLKRWKPELRILLQVHDQFVFEIPTNKLDNWIPKIIQLMTDFPLYDEDGDELPFEIPLEVDVSVGKTWGDLEPWESQTIAA